MQNDIRKVVSTYTLDLQQKHRTINKYWNNLKNVTRYRKLRFTFHQQVLTSRGMQLLRFQNRATFFNHIFQRTIHQRTQFQDAITTNTMNHIVTRFRYVGSIRNTNRLTKILPIIIFVKEVRRNLFANSLNAHVEEILINIEI